MPENLPTARGTPLGDLLVHLGVITPAQLQEALKLCAPDQHDIGNILVEKGFTVEEKILKAVSARQQVPYFMSFSGMLDATAAKLIPERMSRRCAVVPICETPKGLLLGMVNALDIYAIDLVAAHTGLRVLPVLTTRQNLFESIGLQYHGKAKVARKGPEPGGADKKTSRKDGISVKIVPRDMAPIAGVGLGRLKAEDVSVIDSVDAIIADGVAAGASDIHMEPTPEGLQVRFRVDGMLQDRMIHPKEIEPAIVARVKILARLDITETRVPQDGHISVDYGGRGVDLRVSSLPTIYGEKMVIRVLEQAKSRLTLKDLGMPAHVRASFEAAVRRPMGLVLVNGPTGSGKTTTLYAAMNSINSRDKNIVTLEDPVEYRLGGINQVETNARIGLTFASGLRAILRQDPNVILVGEIRDGETAGIAVSAAITGHMVLSTLHTKDAVGTVVRLLNMGVEPLLLSAALSGVLAQRLVRSLCQKCKKEYSPAPDEVARIGVPVRPEGPFYTAGGCKACLGLGYKGRIGIFEWLPVERGIRALINTGASDDAMRVEARKTGVGSLQEEALAKVYDGLSTLAEVVRVTHEEEEAEEKPKGN